MGYLHIENLYREQTILLFRECFAMEKIHGTSAHISWNNGKVGFFSGGESYERFRALFDEAKLSEAFLKLGHDKVMVFGEAYGGKCQGMSHTYGKELKFIAFDVKIGGDDEDGGAWLDVPNADQVATGLGLEFVSWKRVEATVETLDKERDADSQQAHRNGCGPGKKMEGVVLRPLVEFKDKRGNRVICKHKRDEFRETATPRQVVDPAKQVILAAAQAIADEWATDQRLRHVLDKVPGTMDGHHCMEQMRTVIRAMQEDVIREAKGEIVESKEALAAIATRTAKMFKTYLTQPLDKAQ